MKKELIYDFVQQIMKITPIINQNSSIARKTIFDMNIPPMGIACIFIIKKHEGISLIELSNKLHIAKQQLSRLTKALVLQGLIIEKIDPHNKSKKNIYLTENSTILLEKIKENFFNNYVESLETMSDEDIKKATTLLAELSDILSKYYG